MSEQPNWPLRVGDTRASQLMYAHGVGGLLDLPHFSVLVMGLSEWARGVPIEEPRLLAAVQTVLPKVSQLFLPAAAPDVMPGEYARIRPSGVPVRTFPGWLTCSRCHILATADGGIFKLRRNPVNPAKNHYVHEHCSGGRNRPPPATPVRFLVACAHGHLDEFPWHWFLHGGRHCDGNMTLRDVGLLGDFGSVVLACEACDRRRFMTDAFGALGRTNMPRCRGLHPHLERFDKKGCSQRMTAVTVGSSNVWFPLRRAVLSLPEAGRHDPVDLALTQDWQQLGKYDEPALLEKMIDLGLHPILKTLIDDGKMDIAALWARIQAKKQPPVTTVADEQPVDLLAPEWATLTGIEDAARDEDFEAVREPVPTGYAGIIERVVLLERLREVTALIGFTRLDSPDKFAGDDEEEQVRRAPLSQTSPTWAPAAETRGEGIFIQFKESILAPWAGRQAVGRHGDLFHAAHLAWRSLLGYRDPSGGFPGIRYVLLHTFAHVLMRRMALECGYHLAALREKIYSAEPQPGVAPMAGVLIYTAQSDSEGSLGGLVALGRQKRLAGFLDQALEQGRLCSSDPLCAEHRPSVAGQPSLHGACCHACLFLPENACECGNRYLDRSLLVATVDRTDLAYFGSQE